MCAGFFSLIIIWHVIDHSRENIRLKKNRNFLWKAQKHVLQRVWPHLAASMFHPEYILIMLLTKIQYHRSLVRHSLCQFCLLSFLLGWWSLSIVIFAQLLEYGKYLDISIIHYYSDAHTWTLYDDVCMLIINTSVLPLFFRHFYSNN